MWHYKYMYVNSSWEEMNEGGKYGRQQWSVISRQDNYLFFLAFPVLASTNYDTACVGCSMRHSIRAYLLWPSDHLSISIHLAIAGRYIPIARDYRILMVPFRLVKPVDRNWRTHTHNISLLQ